MHGAEYREQSNTRLSRESTIEAARGNILDQSGNKLATTTLGYCLELYKTKITTEELNNALLKVTQVLEKNGDTYSDTLPIKVEPFSFVYDEETMKNWKKENNIEEDKTAEECFYILKEKYKIQNENLQETRKIMTLRYGLFGQKELTQNEKGAEFPGIGISTKAIRSYTSGSLASHIIGYIGQINSEEREGKEDRYGLNDIIGKTGIEDVMEDYLKGTNGVKQIDMAVNGGITDEQVTQEAVAGADVILTIDANLQRVTENTLKTTMQEIQESANVEVTGGSAVVMKVKTGEVLAMASYPDFEPEDFVGGISTEKWNYYTNQETSAYAKMHPFVNRAISSSSSPGSTYKMATALAGLETGKITLKEKINDTGRYTYYKDYQPYCWNKRGHGYLNVTEAIVHSCNYFFYEVGRRVGWQDLSKYAKALGLGKKTGVELPGERTGYVSGPETSRTLGGVWNGGNVLSAAIGQENNSFTTLQMAKYTSILANGGKDVDVTIIKSVVDAEGKEISRDELQKYINKKLNINQTNEEKVTFKEQNVKAILEGMKGVTTESGGTAYSIFKNFNIEVGGKTGSAQTGQKDAQGRNITNAWFVGFAPYDEPEIAIVVMIENGQSGGQAAVPARDIIAEYFGMNANRITEEMNARPTTEIQN